MTSGSASSSSRARTATSTRSTRLERRRRGAGRRCGTSRPRSTASPRSILPGGFAYGDYLRAGVIARFSPVMRAVAAFAADGGLVLGICNGFQVLTEAGLAARRAAAQPRPAVRRPRGRDRRRAARHAVHRARSASGGRCGCRSPTARAATTPTTATLDALERDGQVLFRYVDADGRGRRRGRPGQPQRLAPRDRRGA